MPPLKAGGVMQFFEVVKQRRSVRAFTGALVEADKLAAILDAARLAPSAGNLQAYQVVVADDAGSKKALAAAALGQDFLAEAPVVLVFCASPQRSESKYGLRGTALYCIQDATIAACYAQLAAAAQGLASCWVGAFDEARVKAALRLPRQLRPISLLPIGYAAEAPERPQRRALDELVHRGRW
jgi:nitroreductase